MSAREKVAVVTGASGIVGRRLAMHLASLPDWRVIGVARRLPQSAATGDRIRYLPLDLMDVGACRSAASSFHGVTHLYHGARFDHDTSKLESPDINSDMLANLLDVLEDSERTLEHVHLIQGTKYYGSHLGPFSTPAKESDPRSLQSNFYYTLEDMVKTRSATRGWSWSACRPHAIVDLTSVVGRSIPVVLAIYAEVSKELGLPLCFPGTEAGFRALYQFSEAGLLARAVEWMSTSAKAANNAFNVTNGDFIRWCNLWPVIADCFGMEVGPVRTVRLASVMADKHDVWDRIAKKYGLPKRRYDDLALWSYGDFVFHAGWDIMSSTTKMRMFGFHEVMDTETMLVDMFEMLRAQQIIPRAT